MPDYLNHMVTQNDIKQTGISNVKEGKQKET